MEKRQVFDLPERLLLVTEHQASVHRCAQCRCVTKAAFPEGVVSPAQYGERFKATAVYMNVQQMIPEDLHRPPDEGADRRVQSPNSHQVPASMIRVAITPAAFEANRRHAPAQVPGL